jgi:hypothetical protein
MSQGTRYEPVGILDCVVTRGTIEFRELRPRGSIIRCRPSNSILQQFAGNFGVGDPTHEPQPRCETLPLRMVTVDGLFLLTPMVWESTEILRILEVQARMSGGNHVVIHIANRQGSIRRRADVTPHANHRAFPNVV